VFRTILKKHNLAAGDFPEIQSFAAKLNEVKFSEFSTLSQNKIDELEHVLKVDIPSLMAVCINFLCCFVTSTAMMKVQTLTFLSLCYPAAVAAQRERLARILAFQDG